MNTELQTWLNGTPTGGPNADGRYPLTAKDGQVFLVYCPAAQALNPTLAEQPVEIFAGQAQTAADSATTAASDADADRIAAQTAAANAAQSESNALASKNAAATSATNASTSATNAATSEANANTAKTAAETARTGSESARDKALLWADAAENTVVEGTSYSAKHWANKAAASAASVNPSNYATASHGHDLASASANGFMSSAQFNKLAGVADNANNYVHPASHPPSIIAQDASNRFVTDAEKSAWNGKQAALGYTPINKAGDTGLGTMDFAAGARIRGDFNNAVFASRTLFQTTGADIHSNVGVIPSGTGAIALFSAYNSSDPGNAGVFQFRMDSTFAGLNSTKTGTGITRPISFQFDGVEKASLSTAGTFSTAGEIISTNANTHRMVQGNYGVIWRNDGTSLYLLHTASGDQYGTWNSLRPLQVDLASGQVFLGHATTIKGALIAEQNGLFLGPNGIKVRSAALANGLDIGASPSLAGGTDPDVYLYQRNNGAIWWGTNNTLRGKMQADGCLDWEHRIYAKGIVGGVAFSPYDGNVARPAFLASGSYGGGYVMIDGTTYTGAYTITEADSTRAYVIGVGTSAGLTERVRFRSDNERAMTLNGRAWFTHNGVSAGAWYSDSVNNRKWFAGMYSDNDWGIYNTTAGWALTVTQYGRIALRDENGASIRVQPRHFVQSTDPGAAMADGDIWYQI